MSRFQFVADHLDTYPVKWLCELVDLACSSFYAWRKAASTRTARADADDVLAQRIRQIHDGDNTCGVPRITAELNDGAPPADRVNHKRVARVMRERGIAGYRRRRRVVTTIPEPADHKIPDLVKRNFTAAAPNQVYVGDITYLPLADGTNLYLATVIDCHSRRLAGWAVADHMRTELVADALHAARQTRGSLSGAIFHSDHGWGVHEQGLRPTVCRPRGDPVDGVGRDKCRQRDGRGVQCHTQTRGPPGRAVLA